MGSALICLRVFLVWSFFMACLSAALWAGFAMVSFIWVVVVGAILLLACNFFCGLHREVITPIGGSYVYLQGQLDKAGHPDIQEG